MEMETARLDPERQKRARQYSRIRRRLMLGDLILGLVYILIWLLSGASTGLRNFLLMYTQSEWLLVIGFLAIFGGIYFLIDLPLSYYSGFVLPHRFDQSNQTLKDWIVDQLKGLLIGLPLGLLLVEAIYAVLRASPETWWLWAAALLLILNVLLANLAPVLIAPLFYKFEPLVETNPALAQRLTRLAEKANVRVKGVFRFDMSRRTKAANAALAGLGNTRRIILGDTLLDEFSEDEIETVLAHELGHHVHKDIPLGILISSAMTLLGLYLAAQGLRLGIEAYGYTGPADVAAMPLLVLILSLYGLVTTPLENAFSRWRERRADQYALQTTNMPGAFASAMTRLANQNLSEVNPERWVEILLYSHPALEKRIKMAEGYQDHPHHA